MTRVVVIGAGHNGLVAAALLADRGADVLVLEHGARPGGASSSHPGELPGFTHDGHAAFLPMAAVSPALRELELDLPWVRPACVMAHPFDDGSAIALHRDVEATAASLGGDAGAAWRREMERLVPVAGTLAATILSPVPPVLGFARVAARLRVAGVEWARRALGSVAALGHDVFAGDERATAWLAGSAQHSGLPPTATLSGAFGLLLQLVGHSHGWPLMGGGMERFTDALLQRYGGEVRCDASVEAIVVRHGRVAGVRLRGGEEIAADAVVSTVSAGLLARLLPPGALPGRVQRRLEIWRYGTAPFKLDYELSGPVPWAAAEPRHASVVHVGGALDALTQAADEANRGEVPERPALVVGQQSLFDPSRAPEDQHTLYVYAHVPSQYDLPDTAVADRIHAQIERFAPGFSSLVLARLERPPAMTEAENPSMIGGDLAGGSYEPDQQLVFRPDPRLCRYGTPLRGLYMAGASTHPGGAVHGMSGRGAARALLRDRKLKRI